MRGEVRKQMDVPLQFIGCWDWLVGEKEVE
jgi:hypothetical protein